MRLQIGRRTFLQDGTLMLTAAASSRPSFAQAPNSTVQVGIVTDLHYADKPPAGNRHYRETLSKLDKAAEQFQRDKPDFLVELGDLIDAADTVETEQRYLKTINKKFAAICDKRHYVLGNHCVDTLTKSEFLGTVQQEKSYYSFDHGGVHFVVMDACFRSDGVPYQRKNFKWTDPNIPAAEQEWLQADLHSTELPVIVFAHQRLDVSNNHGVRNCADIRKLLEANGNVRAVFQGHSHSNAVKDIGGIHYCTMVAMVEGSGVDNNGYSLMTYRPDGTIEIQGFHKQNDYTWKSETASAR